MKKILLFTTIFILFSSFSFAQDKDSLAHVAVEYAAHNNISALRPLNKKMGKYFPHHVQLFCNMAIARSEGRYEQMVECIDSLRLWYPKQIQTKTQLSLGELKAEGLRQMGKYKELYQFCKSEIKILKRKGLRSEHLKELFHYQEKAATLLGNDKRSQLLQLVDRKLIFQLDSLYNLERNNVDDFVRLRCEVALSKAFNHDSALISLSKKLVDNYIDSLDTEDLSNCIKAHADILIKRGEWELLGKWSQYIKSVKRNHTAPTRLYDELATAFAIHPRFNLKKSQKDCFLDTSYEWPLLVQGKINGSLPVSFTFSTEQPYTLINEQQAKQHKVEIVNDTLILSTTHGFIEASPAWVKQIEFGNILLENVFVYVVHNTNNIPSQMSNVIGLNELMTFGKVTFYPERLLIHAQTPLTCTGNKKKELYISSQNGLCIHATDFYQKTQPLNLDICYPNNILTKKCFPRSKKSEGLDIYIGNSKYTINQPIMVEPKAKFYNGILGMPFLRNYQQVTLDFNQMEFAASGESLYEPTRGKFSYKTDKFYLSRNQEALSSGLIIDQEEIQFLKLLIALGKNDRNEAASISKELRKERSDFYDAYTEAESLFMCGKYREAFLLLKSVVNGQFPWKDLDESNRDMLKSAYDRYQIYQNESPITIFSKESNCEISIKKEGTEIKINGKKTDAICNFFYPQTEISEKLAKKRKVKIIGQHKDTTYGIIERIEIGQIELKHIPCVILRDKKASQKSLPNKGKGIRIGYDALRAFKQVTFLPHCTIYSTQENHKSEGSNLAYTNQWYVEAKTQGGYSTYLLSNKNNTKQIEENFEIGGKSISTKDFSPTIGTEGEATLNSISLPYLVEKFGAITLNLTTMKLQIK